MEYTTELLKNLNPNIYGELCNVRVYSEYINTDIILAQYAINFKSTPIIAPDNKNNIITSINISVPINHTEKELFKLDPEEVQIIRCANIIGSDNKKCGIWCNNDDKITKYSDWFEPNELNCRAQNCNTWCKSCYGDFYNNINARMHLYSKIIKKKILLSILLKYNLKNMYSTQKDTIYNSDTNQQLYKVAIKNSIIIRQKLILKHTLKMNELKNILDDTSFETNNTLFTYNWQNNKRKADNTNNVDESINKGTTKRAKTN